jgi:hypothetical protein
MLMALKKVVVARAEDAKASSAKLAKMAKPQRTATRVTVTIGPPG